MIRENKLHNFEKALARLKEAVTQYKKEKSNDLMRDGMIQRFEFTYELSWKATKEKLEELGLFDNSSPRAVIKEAFSQKIIENENLWLLIIKDRNMTSHVYKEEMADEIAQRITSTYIQTFESLLQHLKKI
ncbi:MAG TPA: nucleotidyltransferase substrate binding protein [Thermotogota bacterium]|nr:nucleotidyltransferase substrate binding protein [Thermotogota bacterium]HPJ88447.1 nucleotidyltransferase substrate binding protein [Thermotogota bacterium]HPR95386.1 nucleotidyltransferase substrate binding protein [Thermotogota bacterium]